MTELSREIEELDAKLAIETLNEMLNQVEKWGVQNHPDGTGPDKPMSYIGLSSVIRDQARETCQRYADRGEVTWRHILIEEVFEGLAEESGTAALRAELIQTAAVALSWVRDLDLRHDKAQAEAEAVAEADLMRSVEP